MSELNSTKLAQLNGVLAAPNRKMRLFSGGVVGPTLHQRISAPLLTDSFILSRSRSATTPTLRHRNLSGSDHRSLLFYTTLNAITKTSSFISYSPDKTKRDKVKPYPLQSTTTLIPPS